MNNLIQKIQQTQGLLLERTDTAFKRFLFDKIDFKQRLIGIIGPRGVGKTTLILQYLKEKQPDNNQALYLLADSVLFQKGDLLKLAEEFYYKHDGQLLCIDEIHRYQNWNQELKNIYENITDLKIIFSGSSSLDLIKGKYDLSRRAAIYGLDGLSFREYLSFEHGLDFERFSLNKLLQDYQKLSNKFIKHKNILKYFNQYLLSGYYPFFKESKQTSLYHQRINNIIDKIIYQDIASVYQLKTQNLITFKKIINFLATITPGEVNINKLASSIGKNHATIAEYLEILEQAHVVRFLTNSKTGHALIRHAKKIYLDNTNLLKAINNNLGRTVDIGTQRELFILNQLSNAGTIPTFNPKGDFELNGIIFEIGGKNKDYKQIENIKKSFLVLDDIIIASKQKIPLYLFGFLY